MHEGSRRTGHDQGPRTREIGEVEDWGEPRGSPPATRLSFVRFIGKSGTKMTEMSHE